MSLFSLYVRVTFSCTTVSRGVYTHTAVLAMEFVTIQSTGELTGHLLPVLYATLCQSCIRSHKVLQNSKQRPPMLAMDTPIYQLRTTPIVVSIKLKADFWFLCFCLSKKVGSQTRRSEPFLGCADPAVGFISETGSCLRLRGLIGRNSRTSVQSETRARP